MAYEQKPNTGSLFKNDRATTEKHPQATGSAIIEGVEYFVDAWTNIDTKGNRYQSLKFKRKDKQAGTSTPARQRQEPDGAAFDRAMRAERGMYERDDPRTGRSASDDLSDDLPF